MTKVTILGQSEADKPKKKIVFHGCLVNGCNDVNYDSFPIGFLKPSSYKEIILIAQEYGVHGSKDVFKVIDQDGTEIIMFGYFNDGIV